MHPRSALLIFLASTALSTACLDTAMGQDATSTAGAAGRANLAKNATQKAEEILVKAKLSPTGANGTSPGGGMISVETIPKSKTTLTRDFIAKLVPSTTAAQIIEYIPGANVSSSDPFGFSDFTDITVHGLDQAEIGFLLEGMPIADVDNYAPFASTWGDAEDYSTVALSQGTVDLNSPLTNSAGGVLEVQMHQPAKEFGGLIDYSYGSYKTQREYIRLETGEILNTGIYGFVSFSNANYDVWRGPGRGNRQHVTAKFVKEWGEDNHVSFALGHLVNDSPSYLNPTLAQYQQFGDKFNFDGKGPVFDYNYWKLALNGWDQVNMSAPSHFKLAENLTLDVTPYYYWGSGGGGYGSSLSPSPNYLGTELITTPLVYDKTQVIAGGQIPVQAYFIGEEYHPGVTTHLDYKWGNNAITGGWWFDYYDDRQAQDFQQTSKYGDTPNAWGSDSLKFPDGTELFGSNFHLITKVNGLFIGDTFSALDNKLVISAGFREAIIARAGTNDLPGPQYKVGANDTQSLPRASIKYTIDDHNMVYVSGAGNARLVPAAVYFNDYNISTGTLSSDGTGKLKDEYSIEEEVGYRYTGPIVASITGFNYNFTNRNISTITVLNGALENAFINAGGQTVRGIDASAGLQPYHGFSPFIGGEFLHATTDNNLPAATENGGLDYLPTTGKIAVRSPRWSATGALNYDDGTFFGNILAKWEDSQYGDFMNEQKIPAHVKADLTLGFRFPNISYAKRPQLQLNLINVSNTHYLSGVASTALNAQNTKGIFGNVIPAGSPSYYVGSGFAALLTLTTGF